MSRAEVEVTPVEEVPVDVVVVLDPLVVVLDPLVVVLDPLVVVLDPLVVAVVVVSVLATGDEEESVVEPDLQAVRVIDSISG